MGIVARWRRFVEAFDPMAIAYTAVSSVLLEAWLRDVEARRANAEASRWWRDRMIG